MIDKEYTSQVRSELKSSGSVVHTVFTEDEFDYLWDHGLEDDGQYIVALTEEHVERCNGLKVDLAPEGPAHKVVVKAGMAKHQTHNTFRIETSEAMKRAFMPGGRDMASIPKVTPEDANVAAKSLDFPSSRPSGTALDGMRIDDKENPVEQALISQWTIAQVLAHWGVDVAELCEAIDLEWGIDYSMRIINEVSFAKAKELEAFIASGGRPAPSVNMSPNVLSLYKITQGPTVDPTTVGYSSAFIGRCKSMVKMVLATTNLLRGPCSVQRLEMHMNPVYMSQFSPGDLSGWGISGNADTLPAVLRDSIVGIRSYEDFVKSRQALAVAEKNERVEVGKVLFHIAEAASNEATYAREIAGRVIYRTPRPSDQIMAMGTPSGVSVTRRAMVVDPRRVTAVAFDLFSNLDSGKGFGNLVCACSELIILCALSKDKLNLASVWRKISTSKGIGAMYKDANILNMEKIPEVKSAGVGFKGSNLKMLYFLKMLTRQIDHMRPSVLSMMEQACANIDGKGKIAGSGPMSTTGIAGMPRIWKLVGAMSDRSPRPFSRLRAMTAAATRAVASKSMLSIDVLMLSTYRKQRHLSTVNAFASTLRNEWVQYYNDMMRTWQNCGYLSVVAASRQIRPWAVRSAKLLTGSEFTMLNVASFMCYQEMMVSAALKLAYKWSTVVVTPQVARDYSDLDPIERAAAEASDYIWVLSNYYWDQIEVTVFINDDKITAGSQMARDFWGAACFILTAFLGDRASKASARYITHKQLVSAYSGTWRAVRATVMESVRNDYEMVRANLNLPIVPAEGLKVAPIDTEEKLAEEDRRAEPFEEIEDKPGGTVKDVSSAADGIAASMLLNLAPRSSGDYDNFLDILYGAEDEIAGVDEACDIMIPEIMDAIREEHYISNTDLFEGLKDSLIAVTGATPEMIRAAIARSIRGELTNVHLIVTGSNRKTDIMI